VQSQRARLTIIIASMVGDIQVYLIGQALDLPFWAHPIIMDKE
jgi:membrane protein DedA with SNARE-associated domain